MSKVNIQEIATAYNVAVLNGVTTIDGRKGDRRQIIIRANANGFGAGIKQLVDANTNKATGITNLENRDMLPTGKEYMVRGLKISYAPVADANVKTANYGTDAGQAAFVNGEIKIEQDGVLLNLPIRAVSVTTDQAKQYLPGEQYYEVLPFFIRNGKAFGISVEPVGAIATDMCFEVALDIIEIATSSKTSGSAARSC